MNTQFVILRLGEESSMMSACGRAIGFFAKPQNDGYGKFIYGNPLNGSAFVSRLRMTRGGVHRWESMPLAMTGVLKKTRPAGILSDSTRFAGHAMKRLPKDTSIPELGLCEMWDVMQTCVFPLARPA
jgi:hypothetical protein